MIRDNKQITNEQDLIFLEKTGFTLDFLFKKYYPKLVYNLGEKCRDRERAEEYATDAFYIAMQKIEQYDKTRGDFSTWLFRIGQNEFLMDVNKKTRDKVTSMDTELDSEGTTLKDFISIESDDNLELNIQNVNHIKCKILIDSLDYISPEYAEVIRLRDIEGYSYKEIAEILDIKINTLKSRIRNARRMLINITKEKLETVEKLLL